MEKHSSLKETPEDNNINIRELVDQYLVHWKWFVFALVTALICAFLYLRYTVPEYRTSAVIMVKDERKGGMQSEMTAFSDLGLMTGIKSNVDNEIEIIRSRTIVEKSIKKLNLNVSYFVEGRFKTVEVYKDKPIDISFFDQNEAFYKKPLTFTINSKGEDKFEVISASQASLGVFTYGNILRLENCRMIVTKGALRENYKKNFSVIVKINTLRSVVQKYKNNIGIVPLGKNTSVVELTLTDPVRDKAEDLLDTVIEIYNQDAIDDKNFISKRTQEFIAGRLEIIAAELGDVERDAEGFKRSNRLTDIVSDAGIYLQNSVDFEKALIETETQLRVVSSMSEFMNTSKSETIPSNIIPNDNTASALIGEHNQLVIDRDRILKGATPRNSVVINLNNKIEEIRANIIESLGRLSASLKIRKSDLEKQVNMVVGKISEIPSQERAFRVIDRQQKIKESLYIYLLQKREEIAISLAVTASNAKVIDAAISSSSPVQPQKKMVYLGALVLGLLLPFSVIYVLQLMDTKIKTRQDIEGKLSIPYLGDIPRSHSQYEIINAKNRSSSAEAMRIARTNMEFILSTVPDDKAKTIFVTSTLPKEGKTFISINMASTIALSGKKVLLIGMDIRNPKIDQYTKLPDRGLTNYLAQKGNGLHDYIVKLPDFENFYVLPAGIAAPNPVELLMSEKVDLMFAQLKQEYDYIIVDTAPVSVVTDTLLVAKYADAFIYVMRANYLDKRMIKLAESFYQDKKLPNMALILNDTIWRKGYGTGNGYGYGYGYIDVEPKKPWYKRIFSF